MKKITIFIGVLIIVIISVFLYWFSSFQINKNSYNFSYSNPWNVLPKDKLMSTNDLYNNFLTKSQYSYYNICASTNKEPAIFTLFRKDLKNSCNNEEEGCDSIISRIALVCGDEYVIEKPSLSGPQYYGIFELE